MKTGVSDSTQYFEFNKQYRFNPLSLSFYKQWTYFIWNMQISSTKIFSLFLVLRPVYESSELNYITLQFFNALLL